MKKKKTVLFFITLTLLLLVITKTAHTLLAAPLSKDHEVFPVEVEDLNVQLEEDFPSVTNVEIDQSYKKEVTIKNKTNGTMFVRVMILPTLETPGPISKVQSIRLGTELLITGMDSEWVDGEDGYYYYMDKIEEGDSSEFLMTDITLTSHSVTGLNEELTIVLKVESTNNAKYSYRDAWWNNHIPVSGDPLFVIDGALKGIVDS